MTTRPGEVYWVDLGIGGKVRPVVVLSREDEDAPRALAVSAPITTSNRDSEYEVKLPRLHFLRQQSYVNVQGMQAIQHHELSRSAVGRISGSALEEIYEAVRYLYGLSADE